MLSSPLLCPGPEKQSLPMAADMRQERLCLVRGSWGLDKVQVQFRRLVPDAQSAPDPGLVSLLACMAQTWFLTAESSHLVDESERP